MLNIEENFEDDHNKVLSTFSSVSVKMNAK